MSGDADGPGTLLASQRAIAQRLRARQAEIADAALIRVTGVGDLIGSDDPTYVAGLHAAVAAAVEYALSDPAHDRAWPPAAVLEQVRRAAELGVGLETVLCRLVAGHGSVVEFIMEEAYREGTPDDHHLPRSMRRALEALLARLTEAAANEHRTALSLAAESPGRRRAKQVRQLVEGKPVDCRGLGYEFDDLWHLGMIATGPGSKEALAHLQMQVGGESLVVPEQAGGLWGWLGSSQRDRLAEIGLLSGGLPAGVAITIGEPRQGLNGWRLTHREARAALPLLGREGIVRCADVLLEAALLKDRELAGLLREVYLSPLDDLLRDSTDVIHETLRVYFASGHNVKVTAARLEVDRRTVWYRLDKVAKRLGCPPEIRRAELEVALRLAALDDRQHDRKRVGRKVTTSRRSMTAR
jgi:PucR C-terminal helix-turn-helix domain